MAPLGQIGIAKGANRKRVLTGASELKHLEQKGLQKNWNLILRFIPFLSDIIGFQGTVGIPTDFDRWQSLSNPQNWLVTFLDIL